MQSVYTEIFWILFVWYSFCCQTHIALEAEDVQAQNVKLNRRVGELREQVARETSLRTSLEESHKSLLQRIEEMGTIVETERGEVGDRFLLLSGSTCS